MTNTAFKKAMIRGLGRCVIELNDSNNIEKYRDIVLWGCLNNLSYDTQCEGTRSEYMYVLQSKFENDFFEIKIIEKFIEGTKDSWLFEHYANMLYLFAFDGSEKSHDALYLKYEEILSKLINIKRYVRSTELQEQFEWLCIWLVNLDYMSAFKRIVSDIGGAYLKNPKLTDYCTFEWFYEESENICGKKRINKYMQKGIKQSEEIRKFYESITAYSENTNIIPDKFSVNEVLKASKDEWNKYPIIRFSREATDEELLELARITLEEPKEKVKANLLWAFRNKGFPLDAKIIIDYTKSDNENLKEIAFEILAITKNKIVYEYAFELIKNEKHLEDALSILFRNFKEKDTNLIFSLLKRVKVSYREGIWHGVYTDAISWIEHNSKIPKKIILYLYENTLCSYCRGDIVRVMSKRGILKDLLLKECLYDSNDDIRKIAKRKYKRMNQ